MGKVTEPLWTSLWLFEGADSSWFPNGAFFVPSGPMEICVGILVNKLQGYGLFCNTQGRFVRGRLLSRPKANAASPVKPWKILSNFLWPLREWKSLQLLPPLLLTSSGATVAQPWLVEPTVKLNLRWPATSDGCFRRIVEFPCWKFGSEKLSAPLSNRTAVWPQNLGLLASCPVLSRFVPPFSWAPWMPSQPRGYMSGLVNQIISSFILGNKGAGFPAAGEKCSMEGGKGEVWFRVRDLSSEPFNTVSSLQSEQMFS